MAQEATQYEIGQVVGYVQPPEMSCPMLPGDPHWHVMRTLGSGATALAGLTSRGFRCYGPTILSRIMRRGRRIEVERDMFPGYVLADLRDGYHDFGKAKKAPGIADFLKVNEKPLTIPSPLVEAMRERERTLADRFYRKFGRNAQRADFEVGQRVDIVDGPFRSFFAKVQGLDDKGRVQVLIEIFGRQTPAWLDGEQVEAA